MTDNNSKWQAPDLPLSFGREMPPDRHPEIVQRLKAGYEEWFEDVSASRGYDPPKIHIGAEYENPVILTRQDWRMVGEDGWGDSHLGYWEIFVAREAQYEVRFRFGPFREGGTAELRVQGAAVAQKFERGETEVQFSPLALRPGEATLQAHLKPAGSRKAAGVRYLEVRRIN